MKVGYHVGYWSDGPPTHAMVNVRAAEDLGFDSLWTAEGYGSDCLTPLAWWGASTSRIRLGTNVLQLSARTPAATAMAAMTLDHLSDGRFVLGLGASGPQVVEGWYGQPYRRPLARTREYIEIVRKIVARDSPVEYDGEFYRLPNHQQGAGLGKPLRSTLHPRRRDIPIFLGAEGPKNVALAAEIADGWLPLFFSPRADGFYRQALAEGFARPGARRKPDDFEVAASVAMIVDDVEKAADRIRPGLALYIGGMGAKGTNFHFDVFARMGWEDVCHTVQRHYMAGHKRDAIAAIPTRMVTDVALIGSPAQIRSEVMRWSETVVTTLLVQSLTFAGDDVAGLRAIAEALR